MCLTCGCMDAHKEMGRANIRYEDVKHAAYENGRSVQATLAIMDKTEEIDRRNHPAEYAPSSTASKNSAATARKSP
jgi:hypothetical protein